MFLINSFLGYEFFAQEIKGVKPKEINEVLINPGIGFMTFIAYFRFDWKVIEPE